MSFTDSLEHATEVKPYRGEIPIWHRYTAGVAGERFLRSLKAGRLFGTECHCGYTYFPARMYCERCMEHLDEASWVEVGPEGDLISYTAVAIDLDGNELPAPRWVGLVQLDGASGLFVHDLDPEKCDRIAAGGRVRAVLKPADEREGSIRDILYFQPI
jgi:uncharacterized OB-fold protein